MKSIKYLVVFALAVLFSFSSCTKENSIVDITDPNPVTPKETSSNPLVNRGVAGEEGLDMVCFTIKFPFELSVNGTSISISSEDDFLGVLENLNPDDSTFIDFVYPLEIIINDSGEEQTINDGIQLGEAFAGCVPDTGWGTEFPAFLINGDNSCFELNYPVKLVDDQSIEYTANDEDTFIELIAEHEFLSFVFPISLTNIKNQETVDAASAEMLLDLLLSCDNDFNPDTIINSGCFGASIACYSLGFPVNYTDVNGDVKTADNNDELMEAFLTGKVVDYAFPMTLIAMDSTSTTVNTQEELEQAISKCGDFGLGIDPDLMPIYLMSTASNCYKMVYPITITSDGGDTTSELANEDDLIEEIYNQTSSDIVFPFTLLDVASDENKVFNNSDELYSFISQCN